MDNIIKRISKIEHGFKPIETEAVNFFNSKSEDEIWKIVLELMSNKEYQVRSMAVFILGFMASEDSGALAFLKNTVSKDPSWQVQEILAKAFDQYCSDTGYEKSIPIIREWLSDENPNVCRAVTEGLRIWTGRPFFDENPLVAIQLISQNRASESEYLRKSVGNSLRDISKKHSELVKKEIETWDRLDKKIQLTLKFVTK